MTAALLLKIADELEAMRDRIEALGGALCSDLELASKHSAALQGLDMMGQQQLALARVLRAADPIAAVDDISLEGLRERLLPGG